MPASSFVGDFTLPSSPLQIVSYSGARCNPPQNAVGIQCLLAVGGDGMEFSLRAPARGIDMAMVLIFGEPLLPRQQGLSNRKRSGVRSPQRGLRS